MMPLDRRSLLQAINLMVVILLGTLMVIKLLIVGLEQPPVAGLVVVPGCLANAWYLHRNGSVDVAARVFIGLLLFGLAVGGANTGGFVGPVVILSPIIPIFAMLLLNGRAAALSLFLVGLILSGLFVFDVNGVLPQNLNSTADMLFGRLVTIFALALVSTWVVWHFARVTGKLLGKIEQQSHTDYLTGIFNRRGIEMMLQREVGRARRNNSWLSLIMIDVDSFKLYNDTNGHQAGDSCLVNVARVISACIGRKADVVGRFGGEEFLVILPDTSNEGALKVAEKIRRHMLDQKVLYGSGNANPVSLTLGVISARGSGIADTDHLVRQADDALYQGKQKGRNCVVSLVLEGGDESPLPG